jgi:hypothetical protein
MADIFFFFQFAFAKKVGALTVLCNKYSNLVVII